MASFDILSKVDSQFLDNAINVTKKEVLNRYDFKDSVVNVDLNKKDNKILLLNQINDNKSIFSIDKKIENSLNKNQNNYFYKNIR